MDLIEKVVWECPKCKRVRWGSKKLLLKICFVCQVKMEKVEDGSD